MAELILTPEEKAAALWSDLDDAALGMLVKKKMSLLTSAAEQLSHTTTFAAAMLLCCAAAENNAREIAFDLEGLFQAGREFGDWRVVATKASMGGEPTELDRLRDEVEHLSAEKDRLSREARGLHAQLTEARANDRTTFGYLSAIREAMQHDGDFPSLVTAVASLKALTAGAAIPLATPKKD